MQFARIGLKTPTSGFHALQIVRKSASGVDLHIVSMSANDRISNILS